MYTCYMGVTTMYTCYMGVNTMYTCYMGVNTMYTCYIGVDISILSVFLIIPLRWPNEISICNNSCANTFYLTIDYIIKVHGIVYNVTLPGITLGQC